MDSHYRFNIPHYLLLLLLASCYMQSTTKLCFCLAADELSSSVMPKSCIDQERQALLIFKQHIHDASGRLSSWVGHDCCRWKGVSCNNHTGHVVKMDLRSPYPWDESAYERSYLGGEINQSLLGLKHLNYLDLSYNDFHGIPIPKFFGQLKSLQYLSLSHALFTGEIPPSLGNLSSLNFLDLGSNSLLSSRNLNWLSHLSSLKYLDLGGVDLGTSGVSWAYDINMLPLLLELHLSECQIESIPISLQKFNLTSLLVLDLSGNGINSSSFPSWLLNLTSLITLDLSGNDFSDLLPSEFANFKSLESLDLSSCELEGQLPASLGMLKGLQNLNLAENNLWGSIPESIGNLSSLKTLDFSHNNMNGSIPESMGQLSQLVSLDLSYNPWEGILTEAHFINLTRLQNFRVGDTDRPTSLSFDVAYDWVPPFKLQSIWIRSCQVGSGFGVWLQSQTELVDVVLNGNGISEDSIPEEWLLKISSKITSLDLSHNQFRGKLPSHLKFPNLQTIDLSHNQLEGPLPLWSSPEVSLLDLEGNIFSGPIPSNIHLLMPNLQELYLSENQLNGTIPPSFCNTLVLAVLSLRSNQFSGEFPPACSVRGNLYMRERRNVYMQILDVGHNNLSGNIPNWLEQCLLRVLKLNNNNFGGEIPDSLQNCHHLKSIDLGNNKLSGKIPQWMGGSNHLYMLQLRSNFFTGHIPQELCNLPQVHIIDLSNNSLSGTIPMCLNNLSSLVNGSNAGFPDYPSMVEQARFRNKPVMYYPPSKNYSEQAILTLKGRELVYNNTLFLVKSINLSSNKLQGKIPEKISSLIQLGTLNLSRNQFTGKIPSKIGNLHLLETLDLSQNRLLGQIPQSLSSLTFLNHLNLSYNNLSGRIPSGSQLQTLNDSSIYMENPLLCGIPLSTKCPGDDHFPSKDAKHKNENGNVDKLWFYVSVVLGFIVGFWGVCGTLILKTSWRYAYFQFFDDIKDKAALTIALKVARFQRMFSHV